MSATRELDFGTVWVNDHLALATEIPGADSPVGMGRDLSRYVMDDYSRTKRVMITH